MGAARLNPQIRAELEALSLDTLERRYREHDPLVTAEILGQARLKELDTERVEADRASAAARSAVLAELRREIMDHPTPVPELLERLATVRTTIGALIAGIERHNAAVEAFTFRLRRLGGSSANGTDGVAAGDRRLQRLANPLELFERLVYDLQSEHGWSITYVHSGDSHAEADKQLRNLDIQR